MPEMSNKRTHRTSLSTSDSSFQFLQASHYRAGELYLFCRTERPYPSSGSLFGIFDKEASGVIYLESSSSDLCHFRLWHRLPRGYRCSRCATRSELRDYIFNLACYEYRHTGHRPELPYENPAPIYENSLIGEERRDSLQEGGGRRKRSVLRAMAGSNRDISFPAMPPDFFTSFRDIESQERTFCSCGVHM